MFVILEDERDKVIKALDELFPYSRVTFKHLVFKGEDLYQVMTNDLNLLEWMDTYCRSSKRFRDSFIGKI